jgi:catechol 2,3-dioxygenase-like lactoylglutathione lyase family enzyme
VFDHIGLTVADLERSRAFYAHALAPLGITELATYEGGAGFGRENPKFWIGEGRTLQAEPRMHVAFAAVTRLEVDAFHRAAIAAGGTDNGPPGLRPNYHPDYYGAFVLDPDGHNVEAVCHRPG